MPHSPISRTDSGSVSAIKNFIFGGMLDTSRYHPDEHGGECKRSLKSQVFKSQILRSQVLRPQVLRSHIIKTRITKASKVNPGLPEDDVNFPNNLRSPYPDASQAQSAANFPLTKINNVRFPSFRCKENKLFSEEKASPQYASTPNLTSVSPEGDNSRESVAAGVTGTLPRNFKRNSVRHHQNSASGASATSTLPSCASSVSSSYAYVNSGAPSSDSGFLSDATCPDFEANEPPVEAIGTQHQPKDLSCRERDLKTSDPAAPFGRAALHQDNPTYGCVPSKTPPPPSKSTGREGGSTRKVSSVTLKIENGLFATVGKESKGRARDRRPLDPAFPDVVPPPPPALVIVQKKSPEDSKVDEEAAAGWKRATVTMSGTFLARCVKIEDLSSRDTGDDSREVGRHPPERRESGRFPSAARLLRSLGRNRDDDGGGARARDTSEPRLSRSNPHYHSEGKGLKKKNNWASERELNHSLSPVQKERSHSFCEKADTKRRYSYHENKVLRDEARARLDRHEEAASASTNASPKSQLEGPDLTKDVRPGTPPTPTPASVQSSTPDDTSHENIYENLPAHTMKEDSKGGKEASEGGVTEAQTRPIERAERERRSVRKLTKDSGYETSPYSETDYANIDLYSDADAAADGDGDDITLAPESELAPPSPALDAHAPDRQPDHAHLHTSSQISGGGTLDRRASWQPQGSTSGAEASQDSSSGEATVTEASRGASPSSFSSSSRGASSESTTLTRSSAGRASSRRSPLPRYPSAESLTSFAESLVNPGGAASSSSSLVPAKSTPSLHQNAAHAHAFASRNSSVNAALHASRSTPNLDDAEDGSSMVTKKSSMYSYLHGTSSSSSKGGMGGSGVVRGRYWDVTMGADDTPDREDYAHHLRSSSYHLLHSRQQSALSSGSAGSYHSRQHSNTSNYSESDDLSPRADLGPGHTHHGHHHGMDRARFFSYDNLGPESASHKYHGSWNMSEPDLTLAPPPYSPPGPGFQHSSPISPIPPSSAPPPPPQTSVRHSPTSNAPLSTGRHPSSPPPPPVRDASSLKYIKYGPGHEKYPSWPVPAAAANQVMPPGPPAHDANVSGLPESSLSPAPQGSHRSKSWTEQSEYPKEKSGGYARPYNKKPFNPSFQRQLKTVMERTEKLPKEALHNNLREDMFSSSNYSFLDSYYKPSSAYYPLYDRDGRPLDDKDYSIPSPPERDLGPMGEATLGQVTAAQFEEYARRYEEFGYADLIGTTPLLDQLRRESVTWDGSSERDSGRGESESVADSARYSNGRESVTTVVTNSSSASSSETLKWHGSLSDISIMSGHSRDPRSDHNIVHSSRVQAPQRHNSESVLYYGVDGRGKPPHGRLGHESRDHRDLRRSIRDTESGYPRPSREGKWSREVERNNEMNNLKKFPSYSYTQPLSQITEAPTAEMRETPRSPTRSPQSPTIDISKPPSVAERIHELERQSRSTAPEGTSRWPRDHSGSRERDSRDLRETKRPREDSTSQDTRESCDAVESRSSKEPRDPREHRDSRDHSREHREPSETRGHQRRGSRDSQRGDMRLDFSRTEQKCENGDSLRSPTTLGPSSSRSPTQKDAEGRPFGHENFQNLLNTFTEVDRSDRGDRVLERPERTSSNVSYSYLDPEKKCKVSDATLKSIQKQAVMSFYERHAGKSSGGASLSDLSSASSQSSLVSSPTASEGSQGKWNGPSHASMIQAVRTDRSGRAGKGLARLGRVPEGESDDHSLRPPRRRSMSGRDSGSEGGADDLSKAGSSQRSSLASETASSSRSEQPPALPQKQSQQVHQESVTRTSVTSSQSSISANEDARHSEEAEPIKDDDSSSRAPPSRGLLEGILPASDLAPFPPLQSEPKPPSLPPPAHDEPPPRPPERPPKKPTLRSLFHGPNADAANAHNGPSAAHASAAPSAHPNAHADKSSNDSEMRRIEESANELRNLSPARPYYYRKPPAPDPPKSPEATPAAPAAPTSAVPAAAPTPGSPRPPRSPRTARLHASPVHAAHLVAPTSPTSRSSTPDLPPPPPPPVTDGEVVLNDDPLPPPPTPSEVASPPSDAPPVPPDSPPRERLTGTPPPVPRDASKNIITPQTYHKDSYMAHRRDWKTGFEGRYRRTISPSAANRNLLYSRDDNTNNNHTNNKNNNDNTNNNINSSPSSTTPTSGSATTRTSPTPPQEQERRSSTTPPSGVLRPVGSSSSLIQNNNSKNVIDNDNNVNNNGWAGHARSTSTTVSFTAEELRAFKARRAHAHTQEASAHSSDNKENAPRPLHPSQSSPSLSSSTALRSLASEGSTTSLASGGGGSSLTSGRSGSPASPAKLSPAHSWRTSLDSLHRPPLSSPSPPATATTASDTTSSSPRPITRATSLADPLNKEEAAAAAMSGSVSQEALHLPSTSSVSESLNRIAAISDSLSRSTSVTESLCRSASLTETPTSTHSRASSVSEVPTYLSSPPAAPASSAPAAPSSPTSPVPHDGPVTAHPATVTEEPSPRPLLSTPKAPSSPKSPLSTKSLSSKSSLSPTPLSPTSPLSPTTSKAPTFPSSSASTTASSTTTTTVSSATSSSTTSSTVTNSTPSFPVTSPSMSPTSSSGDKTNIVVLGYGRTRYQEEIDCDQLSKDYAPHLLLDTKLRALLAPGPEHKTAAFYMQGVFTLELRKDLINSTHAHHPDLSNLHTPKTMAPNNTHSHTTPASPPATNGDATTCLNTTSDKSPLPADSAYFTTSESKAKLLTRLRGSGNNLQDTITPVTDHQQLLKRKEELVASIGRKLEILKAEREAIKEEMRLNQELGVEVTQEVEARASLAEAEKYKLHVEEIDKITSLLLGLSGRLARAENALLMLVKDADPEEKRILEGKRDKLRDQLEEAKRLKENTDRRAIQVAKVLNQYLSEDEYADYDHFIKMKAKLIMDAREIDDKIKLGEEQQQALSETMCCKNP